MRLLWRLRQRLAKVGGNRCEARAHYPIRHGPRGAGQPIEAGHGAAAEPEGSGAVPVRIAHSNRGAGWNWTVEQGVTLSAPRCVTDDIRHQPRLPSAPNNTHRSLCVVHGRGLHWHCRLFAPACAGPQCHGPDPPRPPTTPRRGCPCVYVIDVSLIFSAKSPSFPRTYVPYMVCAAPAQQDSRHFSRFPCRFIGIGAVCACGRTAPRGHSHWH